MIPTSSIKQPEQPWVPARGGLPKAEQTRRTRQLIVDTAIRCLAEVGFAGTTMLLISREAGISRGPLHYHFADRNALMGAIAEALPRDIPRAVLTRLSAARTLEQRVSAVIDVALSEHLGPHHFAAMELLLAARNDPELTDAIRPHFARSEAAIDEWWAEYLGELGWTRDRLIALRTVAVACLRGLALDHVRRGDDGAHRHAVAAFRDMFVGFAGG